MWITIGVRVTGITHTPAAIYKTRQMQIGSSTNARTEGASARELEITRNPVRTSYGERLVMETLVRQFDEFCRNRYLLIKHSTNSLDDNSTNSLDNRTATDPCREFDHRPRKDRS